MVSQTDTANYGSGSVLMWAPDDDAWSQHSTMSRIQALVCVGCIVIMWVECYTCVHARTSHASVWVKICTVCAWVYEYCKYTYMYLGMELCMYMYVYSMCVQWV